MSGETRLWSARRHLVAGYGSLFLLAAGLGGWGTFARLDGAVLAQGQVEVRGNRQIVQHAEGGVIKEILAREGDRVEEGTVLVRLDDKSLRSELAIIEGQFFEVVARRNRLAAERDGAAEIAFDAELLLRARYWQAAADLIAAQNQQFHALRAAHMEEVAALRERIAQVRRQIDGLRAQRAATEAEALLVAEQVSAQQALFDQQLTRRTDLLVPRRDQTRLQGAVGQLEASIAEGEARIAEIEVDILRLGTEQRKQAIAELRDLEFREIELRGQRTKLREQIDRLDLRSPAAGIVYASKADTLRSVLRPAEPAMFIVPEDDPLVIRARVQPTDIDNVWPGQPATLRFSVFNSRTAPEVNGEVAVVSADSMADERTGAHFYRVEIRLQELPAASDESFALLPGMPVEAFIRTGEHAPLTYLVKPLADYFIRAFRET